MNCVAIDLFCGIGGLTFGVQKTGINVVAGIDIDSSCQYAYETNNKAIFINKGVEEIEPVQLEALYPSGSIRVLMGCAPCQPFSNYSLRYMKNGRKDDKWKLLYYFMDLVKKVKPDIVSMENVPQLSKEVVFNDFLKTIKKLGYNTTWKVVDCAAYGVPQHRNRLVLLASNLDNIELIKPLYTEDTYLTVADAIKNMPSLQDGEISTTDPLHKASRLSAVNRKRIKQSVPGGTWHDWSDELRLPCHKKKTGRGYRAVYGRMEWNKPSPTITTQFYGYGNGRFGHPEQDRAISFREGALLQSFPIDYMFIDPENIQSTKQIGTHIGNAVPVELGVAVGLSILEHLKIVGVDPNGKKSS